jgi:DNA (cytosine-5)-methyltransferase 1
VTNSVSRRPSMSPSTRIDQRDHRGRAPSRSQFTFVDLFSGAGGMSYGFRSHPAFRPIFAVDAQIGKPSSRAGTLDCNASYEANIGIRVREADLAVYEPRELMREAGLKRGELDVLISCAPCTGFSRNVNKNHSEDDYRNGLVGRTREFVDALRPAVLVMENARELIRGNFSTHYERLRDALELMGYSVSGGVHMLTAFGLPQARERALVVAVRDRGRIRTLTDLWEGAAPARDSITVRRAIGHLLPVMAGVTHPDDPLHRSPGFSNALSLERMRAIPHDGGSWRDLIRRHDANRLLAGSMKRLIAMDKLGSHPDKYGRLWWDRPSVTIKRECGHVGNGRYAHPEQDRLCTVRELALLNGFPATYQLLGSMSNRYRHIGDAVPPLISYQIAHACNWILTGKKPRRGEWCLPGTSLRPADVLENVPELRLAL